MSENYFMSYSRQELYYAEALVLGLQRAGLDIWFDLQQLEPGCNWEEEIERGLQECTGVILLVSRASMASPWVANEWEHALNTGKPIYLVLFEAADMTPFTLKNGREVRLDQLVEVAAGIVDARRDFKGSLKRLTAVLQDGVPTRDAIPVPNRFKLSLHVPLAINTIVLAMLVFALLLVWASVSAFIITPPLMVAGLLTAAWVVERTVAFMQRRSYRETRVILACASFLSLLINPVAAPVMWIATALAFFAPDIHRYSPLGQGLEGRQRRARLQQHSKRKTAPRGFWNNLSVIYGRLHSIIKILVIFFGVMVTLFFVLNLSTLGRGGSGAGTAAGLLPFTFVLGPGIVIGTFLLRQRYNRLVREGLGTAESSGLTYRVVYSSADSELADQISKAMNAAGHHPRSSSSSGTIFKPGSVSSRTTASDADPVGNFLAGKTVRSEQRPWYNNAPNVTQRQAEPAKLPDYTFVLLTNNIARSEIQQRISDQERLVFLVASPLDNAEDFREFARFQWVDIRRQTPDLLAALAEDLMIFGSSIVSHSFGTRQTPQSFEKLLVPPRVAGYLALQYAALYVTVTTTLAQLAMRGGEMNTWLQVVLLLPSIFLTTWLINRIVRREITIPTILNINLVFGVISYVVGLMVGLSQPLPPGYVRDTGFIMMNILTTGGGLIIGYYIGRGILRSTFSGWLPSFVPFPAPFPGFQRDRDLWMRNMFACTVIGLVTLMFSASSVVVAADSANRVQSEQQMEIHPYLSLEIPGHWKDINQWDRTIIRAIPLKAILLRLGTPVSEALATMLGSEIQETLTPPDQFTYTRITLLASAASGSTWEPLYRTVYVPEPLEKVGVGFSAWEIPEALKAAGYEALLAKISDSTPAEPQTLADGTRLWQAERTDNNLNEDEIYALYDTSSADFLLVLGGDAGLVAQEQARLTALLDNAQVVAVEPSPTATVTPTATMTPTLPPTATPTLFPTFESFAVASNDLPDGESTNRISFDGFAFNRPAFWAYTTDITDQVITWSDSGYSSLNTDIFAIGFQPTWAAAVRSFTDVNLIAVYAYTEDQFLSLPDLMNVYASNGDAAGMIVEDRILSDNDPIKLRRIIIDTARPGFMPVREWLLSVETDQADYLIWVVGNQEGLKSRYVFELDEWLASFTVVE